MRNNIQTRKLDHKRPLKLNIDSRDIHGCERVILQTRDGLREIFQTSYREDLPSIIERPIKMGIFDYDRSIGYEKSRIYKFDKVEISQGYDGKTLLVCWIFKEWMEQ